MFVDISPFDTPVAPARLQRANGALCLAFGRRGDITALKTLYQEGSAKARLPRAFWQPPEVVLINTAGGLAGGDSFSTEITLDAEAALVATTQACERVYRSIAGPAEVSTRLALGNGARLDWLPQETILFNGGMLRRRLEVDLAGSSEFLAVEAVLFGRTAMGESVRSGSFHDRWRIRREGRLQFADDVRLEGDIADQLVRPAVLGGNRAMATIIFTGQDMDALLDPLRDVLGEGGGASAWGGKLLARIAAPDSLELRSRLFPALSLLMKGRPLPKVWQL
ncbi:MAG: urease accessory protein UreD [Rhizobiaceae bacterium]